MKNFLALLALFSSSVFADWKPTMIARATLFGQGHNMPPASSLANTSPRINNRGDILLKMSAVEGEARAAIWLHESNKRKGEVIFRAGKDEYLGDPTFNLEAETVFHHFDEFKSFGIKFYDPAEKTITTLLSPDDVPGTLFFGFAQINDARQVLYRALHDDGRRSLVVVGNHGPETLLKEDGQLSYIFGPAFNNFGHVLLKVRLGGGLAEDRPDQIRFYDRFGGHRIIARDQNDNRSSAHTGFHNNVSLGSSQHVVYIAKHVDGKKEMLLAQGRRQKVIAKEGTGDVKEFEHFGPTVNTLGEVLFRAFDKQGRRSLFVYTNRQLIKLVSEGDPLPCDLEETCYVTFRPGFPGISGRPDINDWGEVVAHLILSDKNMENYLGSAIYRFSQIK